MPFNDSPPPQSDIEYSVMSEQIETQSGEPLTPLDACLACPHFKRLCRSTVSGLFGLLGRRSPPAA